MFEVFHVLTSILLLIMIPFIVCIDLFRYFYLKKYSLKQNLSFYVIWFLQLIIYLNVRRFDMTQEDKDKIASSSNLFAEGFTKIQYQKVNHKEVSQLENSFSKWYKLFKENGLNYLSKKSISLLQKDEYRIVPYVKF